MAEFILKDSKGKEQTFNNDKIFVQGTDGELVQFTEGKGESVLEPLEVTKNGNYTPSEGVDGFSSVEVNVPDIPAVVQALTVTENGTYNAPSGVDGFDKVTVEVPTPEIALQDKTITENGTFTADSGFDGLGSVTVAVEGAGGGSLPAGGYWGVFEDIPRPNNYSWNFFELGGELYALASKATGSTGSYYRYKMVDGAWVQLEDVTWIDGNVYVMKPVEYNGKLHFVPSNERSYHWTFDGTIAEKKANFPGMVSPRSLFVHENKLKCLYDRSVYVWNEETDTWSTEATLTFRVTYACAFVVNGVVYIIESDRVYVYEDGTVTSYDTGLSGVASNYSSAIVGGKLYYYKANSTNGHDLYCYDFATKTNSYVTKIPNANVSVSYLKSYSNKLVILPGSDTYGTIFQLYEVTE